MISFKVLKINYKLIIILTICIVSSYSSLLIYNSYAANKEKDGIIVPIIMYHSILKSKSGSYIVHPSEFEDDLKYIKENGYSTITMSNLIEYVYDEKELPQKPIIITFDDGYYNNLGYVFPLLKKYDMKAVISIVGEYTDKFTKSDEANLNYGYLRWKDIKQMMDDGCIEFQNHTYNLHNIKNGRRGCMKKFGESTENYKESISEDIIKLQNEFKDCTGYIPNTFTYPFGAISNESLDIIKELGFKASFSCTAGVNHITKNAECLYKLKRNNRVSGISTSIFFEKMYLK